MAILDFAALANEGKTAIYAETESKDTSPGDEWVYWSDRVTPDVRVAVWRKVVTVAEAEAWHSSVL